MSIIDELFDSEVAFLRYVQSHPNSPALKKLITTDKLRYWYCKWVFDDVKIASKITSQDYKDLYHYYVRGLANANQQLCLMTKFRNGHLRDKASSRGTIETRAATLDRITATIVRLEAEQKEKN